MKLISPKVYAEKAADGSMTMKAVIQKVTSASVEIDGSTVGSIEKGIMLLLGVSTEDTKEEAAYLAEKAVNLRIFEDENDKMNLSLLDVDGELLIVSNFTLYADCKKGRRPSYTDAARPEQATELYEYFIDCAKKLAVKKVATGEFGAYMQLHILNDGPVTIIMDTDEIMPKKHN